MKILLVEDDPTARRATAALAGGLGHEVETVDSAEAAIPILEKGGIDMLFTDLTLPRKSGLDLCKWVRSREKDAHLYVLLLTAKETVQAMDAAFTAGVDDFVTKGSSRIEIASRFRVAERVVRVERHLRARAAELDTALRRLEISAVMRGKVGAGDAPPSSRMTRGPELLDKLATWQRCESTVRSALEENAHQPFEPLPDAPPWPEDRLAARITMTDTDHQVQMDIVIVTDKKSGNAIATNLFGDPDAVDDSVVADLLLEISNGMMGAFKAAFASEDYKFTPGIPKAVALASANELLAAAKDRRILGFAVGDTVVTVLVGVREKLPRKLKAKELKDGMVLAAPVCTTSGTMLLKMGTRLSEAHIERLVNIDQHMIVELSDPTD